jgi:hypothetical protein
MAYRQNMQTRKRFAGRLFELGLIFVVTGPLLAQTDAERPTAPYHTLLLANGELLAGFVVREVDTIVVTTKRGATLRIPDKEILHFSRDAEDALQFLRRAANLNDCDQVVKLAEWALQNKLFNECEFELNRASQIDSTHTSLPNLQERLRYAQGTASPPVGQPSSKFSSSAAKPVPQLRTSDLTDEERQSLAVFTKHLQPLLVNQCATAGCHGRAVHVADGDNTYLIHRPIRGRGFTSAQSIANLQATLRFVDASQPLESRLIKSLRHADVHAGFMESRQQITLRQIERWLATFPAAQKAAAAANRQRARTAATPVSNSQPGDSPIDSLAKAMTTPPPAKSGSPPNDVPIVGPTSRDGDDPYDPAAFNRLNDAADD